MPPKAADYRTLRACGSVTSPRFSGPLLPFAPADRAPEASRAGAEQERDCAVPSRRRGLVRNQGPDRDVNLIMIMIMIKGYNDWHVDEWCGAYPGRFIPCGILRCGSVEPADEAAHRSRGHPVVFSVSSVSPSAGTRVGYRGGSRPRLRMDKQFRADRQTARPFG